MTVDQIIAALTVKDALAFEFVTDKLYWIENEFLDPNGIDYSVAYPASALRIETALIEILEGVAV